MARKKAKGVSRNRIRLVTGSKGHEAAGRRYIYYYDGEPALRLGDPPSCPRPKCGRTMQLHGWKWLCPKRGCHGLRKACTTHHLAQKQPLRPSNLTPSAQPPASPYPPRISEKLRRLLVASERGAQTALVYHNEWKRRPIAADRLSTARSAIINILQSSEDVTWIEQELPEWTPLQGTLVPTVT